MFAAHFPIEKFHARLGLAFAPGSELFAGTEEAIIPPDVDWQAEAIGPALEDFEQPIFAGLGEDDFLCRK